jgi:hypothetical protein
MMRSAPLIACLLCLAALLPGGAGGGKKAPEVTWEEDLDAARALARKTGKPLFVVIRCER